MVRDKNNKKMLISTAVTGEKLRRYRKSHNIGQGEEVEEIDVHV